MSHSLYPSQYFPRKLPTRQRQGQHSEPQKTLSQIRDHTNSQNPIPLGWKPSVPPEAIQAIRNPAPNLGGDALLKHRALQPEDQRGNRNKGRNTHLNINKPRTRHLDLQSLQSKMPKQQCKNTVINSQGAMSPPESSHATKQALNIPTQPQHMKTEIFPLLIPVTFREGCRPCHQTCYLSPAPTLALSTKVSLADRGWQGSCFSFCCCSNANCPSIGDAGSGLNGLF